MTQQCLWYPNQIPLKFCEMDHVVKKIAFLEIQLISERREPGRPPPRMGTKGSQCFPHQHHFSFTFPSTNQCAKVTSSHRSEVSKSAFSFSVWVSSVCVFWFRQNQPWYEKRKSGFKMLGYSTTLINLTKGNKKNLFNFPRLKTHHSLTIPFLPKLTGTSTSASMSQPPPRHPRTHPSSKLSLCTEVMIIRRGWQWLGVMGSHSEGCQCALRNP